jgi:hypothetical protein
MPSAPPFPRLPQRRGARAALFGALLLSAPAPGGAATMRHPPPDDAAPHTPAAADLAARAHDAAGQDPAGQDPAPGPRLGAGARPCDGRLAMITLAIRDAAGAPVTGARLAARRAGARAPFPVQPQEQGAGEYLIVDDTALRHLARGDVALDVTVAHGSRRRVVRQVVGTTAGGCHVVRRSGAEVVTLR